MKPPSQIISDSFRRSINKWHEDSSSLIKPSLYLMMSCDVQFEISTRVRAFVYDEVHMNSTHLNIT